MLAIKAGDEIEYRWKEHQKTIIKSGTVLHVFSKYLVVFTGMYRDTVMTKDIERGKIRVSIHNGEVLKEICKTGTVVIY